MRPVLLSLLQFLLCVGLSSSALADNRPVVFVHGFCSDSALWNYYEQQRGGLSRYGGPRVNLYFDGSGVGYLGSASANSTSRFFTVDLSYDYTTRTFDRFASADGTSIFEKAFALKAAINEVKRLTGSRDVLVVSHSMGGLVARAYLQGLARNRSGGASIPYGDDIAALFTVGTPNLGAPLAALNVLIGPNVRCGNTLNAREMVPYVSGLTLETLRTMNNWPWPLPTYIVSFVMVQFSPVGIRVGDDVVSPLSQSISSVFPSDSRAIVQELQVPSGVPYPAHTNYLNNEAMVQTLHQWIGQADAVLPAACFAPGPPSLSATVRTAPSGPSILDLSWSVPARGDASTTYVVDAGSTRGGVEYASGFDLGTGTTRSFAVGPGSYFIRLSATNSCGAVGPTSNEVRVDVSTPPLPTAPGAPTMNAAVVVGATVNLSWAPSATGGTPTSYQLGYALTPGAPFVPLASYATTSESIPGVPNGTYYVRVRALNGSTPGPPSNEIVLRVGVGVTPQIVTPPRNQSIPYNGTVTFTVAATGSAPLTYQWYNNGNRMANGLNVSGADAPTLTMRSLQGFNAGTVRVDVSNAAGTVSATATLSVVSATTPPQITGPPQNQSAPYNGSVTFTVAATGDGPLTYQWHNNGNRMSNGLNVSGANAPTLTMQRLQGFNAGTIRVDVSNAAGTVSATATLAVIGAP